MTLVLHQPVLKGVRVIDLSQVVSGAVASMLMAEFGAEVIKVEPPDGEQYRKSGYTIQTDDGSTNLNILRFSRRKKSITLNLKHPAGKRLFEGLLAQGDVVIENFRPGVLDRLGFSYERMRAINPRLVYTTVSGFGHDDVVPSPYRDRPAYALIAEAAAGLTYLAGTGDGTPVWMGFAMADIYAGTLAFTGTLLGLLDRRSSGEGKRVDVAMYDACLLMNDLALTFFSVLGSDMSAGRYALQAPWGAYEVKDGYVAIAVLTQGQWQSVCDVIGRPDFKFDERLETGSGRSRHHDELLAPAISQWSRRLTRSEAIELLLAQGVPAAPVNTAAEVFASQQTQAREMLIKVEDPVCGAVQLVGNPIKLDDMPPLAPPRIPKLGEHTDEILGGLLALPSDEIRRLRAEGAV